jgi:RNA polymerase sigma-70 factor (ECF subfamily)
MQMHLDEKELLQQIRDDPQLFALIYDNHYNAIFSYAFRRLANYDLARDITAECFLKAYQKINSFAWRNIPFQPGCFVLPPTRSIYISEIQKNTSRLFERA